MQSCLRIPDQSERLSAPENERTAMDWLNYHHLLYFWTVAREGTNANRGASQKAIWIVAAWANPGHPRKLLRHFS